MLNCCVDLYIYAWWELKFMTMWCILYTFVHLHKHTYEILPLKAWAVIWYWSTESYMKRVDWLQCQDVGLLEIGWHDKQGQHGWVAKWSNVTVLSCWCQHVESSCVLMHYCWNVENCWETYWQYASCWVINSISIVANNYRYVKYPGIIDLWYVSLIMDMLSTSAILIWWWTWIFYV